MVVWIYAGPIAPTLAVLLWLSLKVLSMRRNKRASWATNAFLQGTILLTAIGTVLVCANGLNMYFHEALVEKTRDTWFEPGSILSPVVLPFGACLCFILSAGPGGTLGLITGLLFRKFNSQPERFADSEKNEQGHGVDSTSRSESKVPGWVLQVSAIGWLCTLGILALVLGLRGLSAGH
jgi:hypothetical protein